MEDNIGPGNIIKKDLEDGKSAYRQNVSVQLEGGMGENEDWAETAFDNIYVLIDKNSYNTIAGVGYAEHADNKYNEVVIERIDIDDRNGRTEYRINPDNYIYLTEFSEEKGLKMEEVYEKFAEYYNERLTQLTNNKSKDKEPSL